MCKTHLPLPMAFGAASFWAGMLRQKGRELFESQISWTSKNSMQNIRGFDEYISLLFLTRVQADSQSNIEETGQRKELEIHCDIIRKREILFTDFIIFFPLLLSEFFPSLLRLPFAFVLPVLQSLCLVYCIAHPHPSPSPHWTENSF